MIKAILFDFGGVLAEEGFYNGLIEIGRVNQLEPQAFFKTVEKLIGDSGYLTGDASESTFWDSVRKKTGITMGDLELKTEILKRFVLRPTLFEYVDRFRNQGFIVAMLSDQTNWLDELNEDRNFFRHFDKVFNSYHIHKSKRDATAFRDICSDLNVRPDELLFIDDNVGHIERATTEGLNVLHFTTVKDFEGRIEEFIKIH